MLDKDKALEKWKPILENMGVTGSRADWMSEYAEQHSLIENQIIKKEARNTKIDELLGTQSEYSGLTFPFVKRVFASTLADGNELEVRRVTEERERIIKDNREGKIKSVLFDEDFEPEEVPEIPEAYGGIIPITPMPGPKIDLMYIDFQYGGTSSEK